MGLSRRQFGLGALGGAALLGGVGLSAAGVRWMQGRPEPLDRSGMTLTFSETFQGPVSFYDPVRKTGRWKTNYWFGGQDGPSSRALPAEKQIYVDAPYCGLNPFSQSDGRMHITASPNPIPTDPRTFNPYEKGPDGQPHRPLPYVSGILTTEPSFLQTYGYFEARMKFPQGRGLWPAFWMLPAAENYNDDEIDVVEWVGVNPRTLVFTAHYARHKAIGRRVTGFDTGVFHDYGCLWTRDEIAWYVDGAPIWRQRNRGLHQPMYMLLNLAVGGWDGNLPEDPSRFPATLSIDHVKAWRLTPASHTPRST